MYICTVFPCMYVYIHLHMQLYVCVFTYIICAYEYHARIYICVLNRRCCDQFPAVNFLTFVFLHRLNVYSHIMYVYTYLCIESSMLRQFPDVQFFHASIFIFIIRACIYCTHVYVYNYINMCVCVCMFTSCHTYIHTNIHTDIHTFAVLSLFDTFRVYPCIIRFSSVCVCVHTLHII